ncbi:glycoside hydrolase domain-containing protein [Myroides odoratimimus]|uniref:glycoside hydrolase domain-containing protein n=1 Tax=Myroides odoratimimus TaxID=76832 RepID=UPI0029C06C4A|nr:glycoside hydrolase domain-containing protein [Myroides odoratimimus]MDX4975000.1 glycoside hydrolase family 92 protein [Myroides odoratimimus]
MRKFLILLLIATQCGYGQKNKLSDKVNVFLGTSGDYGQLSPGASFPFSMLCISPETYPYNHTGYDNRAKQFKGVTHTRLQGVGCKGSGGNILIKPIIGSNIETELIKEKEKGTPGYYKVEFINNIKADFTVGHNYGVHRYSFPNNGQLFVDLSSATGGAFISAEYEVSNQVIQGKISSKTTCSAGIYHFYFSIDLGNGAILRKVGEYQFIVDFPSSKVELQIGFSSVSEHYAKRRIAKGQSFDTTRTLATERWNELLSAAEVSDKDDERVKLFYSLLYRTLQVPYLISEADGTYRTISGEVKKADFNVYHGWALWDNYREVIPMYSILYPEVYKDVVHSIANMYPYGKKDFSTLNEPGPTVRTEHALVVLADAVNKGYQLPIDSIKEYLVKEAEQLDFSSPDKALESSYDYWALSEIFKSVQDTVSANYYLEKAKEYKKYWLKDFKDIQIHDVDKMQARGLYQGTIWQYRWLVPYDIKGLISLIGSEKEFEDQLDTFFEGHYYNHANQPDLQASSLYNATRSAYKSQKLIHDLLLGESIQFYFNDNSKGIDPYIGRIYKNAPQAFLRTMDDDLGTMSAWFVLRSLGFSAANVGSDTFYLNAPVFEKVIIRNNLIVSNKEGSSYIQEVAYNNKDYQRNYITYKEFLEASKIIFKTSDEPNKQWPSEPLWISNIKEDE